MGYIAKRVAIAITVVGGFALLWASLAFGWQQLTQGIVWTAYALLAIGVLVGALGRGRRRRGDSSHPTASDPYSDIQLGRRPPTFYPRDDSNSVQVGGAAPPDPLRLPPEPPSAK